MSDTRPTTQRLDELEAGLIRLADLIGRQASAPSPPGAERSSIWCWADLDETQTGAQWAGLAEWVQWLAGRYPRALREFPPCWYLHPDGVEELTALWAAWRAAYHGDDTPRDGLIGWHDRWLPGVTRRLLGTGGVLAGCAAAKAHRPVNLDGAPRNTFQDGDDPTIEEVAAGADRRSLSVSRPTVRSSGGPHG